ncbi:MAG: T9SS type A sorting domain-containing protein [Flavobacteriales bacterium]|nr:T9SS type A sorting domain-containing protein [Flavobacteriales bacterium]
MLVLVTWVCGADNAQVIISLNTTWTPSGSLPIGYNNGVTINSGVTLTIDGATLNMNNLAKITLNTGAKLIVMNNAKLQSSGLGTNVWNGIVANGDPAIEQFITFPDPNKHNNSASWEGVLNNNQTLVKAENSSILNAKIGIQSKDGAVVRTRKTNFTNCELGINIEPYSSMDCPESNASFVMGCVFKWDNQNFISNSIYLPNRLKHISMSGVAGVNIGGNTFTNGMTAQACQRDRGKGIVANGSSAILEFEADQFTKDVNYESCGGIMQKNGGGGASKVNTFSNLTTGIEAVSSNSNKFFIRGSEFSNCFNSINLNGLSKGIIFECQVEKILSGLANIFKSSGCGSIHFQDVIINDCSESRIIDNAFKYHVVQPSPYSQNTAITIDNTNGTAKIKANDFDYAGQLTFLLTGIDIFNAAGSSSILVECNNFEGLQVDIRVSSGDLDIGSSSKDAANSFTTTGNSTFNIENIGTGNVNFFGLSTVNPTLSNVNSNIVSSALNCTITCDDFEMNWEDFYCPTLGIEGFNDGVRSIDIYPNPTNGVFRLTNLSGIGKYQGSIHTILGQAVANFEAMNEEEIDASFLKSGVYFLKLVSEINNNVYVGKLVID